MSNIWPIGTFDAAAPVPGFWPRTPAKPTEAALRSAPGSTTSITAWRGRSGRRHLVTVRPVRSADLGDAPANAILLAVRRDRAGRATVVAIENEGEGRPRWLAAVRELGVSEIHLHLLADTPAAREAIRADLAASAVAIGRVALG